MANKVKSSKSNKASSNATKEVVNKSKLEARKMKKSLSLPSKVLIQISLLVFILTFVIQYNGNSADLANSLYSSFIYFTFFIIAISFIFVTFLILMVDRKKRIIQEINFREEQKQKEEAERKYKERVKLEEDLKISDLRRLEDLRKLRDVNSRTSSDFEDFDKPEYQPLSL